MNTLSTLIKGNLKNNKSKNILVVITIMLTTVLLTSVFLTCYNWISANTELTIDRSGEFHGIYKNIDVDNINIMKNHVDIESFGVVKTLGSIENEDVELGIIYADENAIKMNNLKLIEGSMPLKENEVTINDDYLDLLGVDKKVGEAINLEYECRYTGEIVKKEFVVSGIIESNEFNRAKKRYDAVVSSVFLESRVQAEDMTFTGYIKIAGENKLSGDEIKDKLKEVATDIGLNEYSVRNNDDYINASNPDPAVITGGIVIVLIVVFSSMLVIYSIFYVSIINKVQEYGRLRAIGSTKKQIKKIILREGLVLATISIPLGIIIGYLISDLIIIKILEMDKYGVGGINIPIIIGILITSYATVFLSLIKPMKIASKVSPVEAMRYNGDNETSKNRKGYEEITVKSLTYANLVRNKKRTIITLASLALSGVLFITISSVMSSMNAEVLAKEHSLGDFTLSLDNYDYDEEGEMPLYKLQEDNPLGKELRDYISNIPGVKEINRNIGTNMSRKLPNGDENGVSFGAYEDSVLEELEENLVDGEISEERLLSGEGVIYTYPEYAEEYGIKVGEKVTLVVIDGGKKVEREFTVDAISAIYGDEFLIADSVIKDMIETDITLAIGVVVEKSKMDNVEAILRQIADSNGFISISTLEESIASNEQAMGVVKVLGYSLVIIIGVIGFMNLINTMITSVITRKKEFGILQAMGLSNKQLINMLQIEGLFYTVGTVGITLTIGNVIGYVAVMLFRNSGASYATYTYPMVQSIILVLAVTLVQIMITYAVTKNFQKESLVDRIRYSE